MYITIGLYHNHGGRSKVTKNGARNYVGIMSVLEKIMSDFFSYPGSGRKNRPMEPKGLFESHSKSHANYKGTLAYNTKNNN